MSRTATVPNGVTSSTSGWWTDLMPGEYAKVGRVIVGDVTITPEAATKILAERNHGNRRPTNLQTRTLARAMERGEFLFTGETILFDNAGRMMNGQHRCFACADSGMAFETMVVVTGLDTDVFKVLDQLRKRQTADILGMLGEAHSKDLASAMVLTQCFFSFGAPHRFNMAAMPTVDENIGFLRSHPGLRVSVGYVLQHKKSLRLFASQAFPAVLHYLTKCVDGPLADQFFDYVFNYQVPNVPRWSAAKLLVNRLVDNSTSTAKLTPKVIAALSVKSWNAVYGGVNLKVLRYSDGEEFPRVAGWEYTDGLPVMPPAVK